MSKSELDLLIEGRRRCTQCLEIKSLTDFYSKGSRCDSCCKECVKEKKRRLYEMARAKDRLKKEAERVQKVASLIADSNPDGAKGKAASETKSKKVCSKCLEVKPLNRFYSRNGRPDGECMECKKLHQRLRYEGKHGSEESRILKGIVNTIEPENDIAVADIADFLHHMRDPLSPIRFILNPEEFMKDLDRHIEREEKLNALNEVTLNIINDVHRKEGKPLEPVPARSRHFRNIKATYEGLAAEVRKELRASPVAATPGAEKLV